MRSRRRIIALVLALWGCPGRPADAPSPAAPAAPALASAPLPVTPASVPGLVGSPAPRASGPAYPITQSITGLAVSGSLPTLRWDAVVGADSYSVFVTPTEGVRASWVASTVEPHLDLAAPTDPILPPPPHPSVAARGKTYRWLVLAFDATGATLLSSEPSAFACDATCRTVPIPEDD